MPTTIINDNFTRADTSAGSAGSTTAIGNSLADITGGTYHISSNTMVGATTVAGRYLTYQGGTYSQGQLNYVWNYADGSRHTGAFARQQSAGNEYRFNVADNQVFIQTVISGTATTIATNGSWASYHFADDLRLEVTISAPVIGVTTITVHVYDVTQSFYLSAATVITDSTSALQSAGSFGIYDQGPSSGSTPDTYKLLFYSTTDAPPALTANGVSFSSVADTTLTVTAAAATGGTTPYSYQFQRAPDVVGVAGVYANVGSAGSSLTLNDTGLTASTPYWYRYVVTDSAGSPATATGAGSSQTTAAAPVVATGYSMSKSATSGPTATPVTLTYTLTPSGGTLTSGTITPAVSGVSGAFSPTTLTLSTGTPSGTITFTPSTAGTAALTSTNNASLTNPSSQNYTVTGSPVIITVTDTNIQWSPYNWYSDGGGSLSSNNVHGSSTYCQSANSGAYVKFAFTGTTTFILNVNPAAQLAANLGTTSPKLCYSLDGGAWVDAQLSNTLISVISLAGLSTGNHSIIVVYKSHVQTVDNWGSSGINPSNSVQIISFTLDYGGSTIAAFGPVVKHSKNMFTNGDSITEGVSINGTGNDLSYNDATLDYIRSVAEALDCEVGVDAFGFLGWYHGGSGNVPRMYTSGDAANSYWTMYDFNHTRLVSGKLSPMPDYWIINLGQNDGPSPGSTVSSLVQGWLPTARAAVNTTTPIILFKPFSNTAGSLIATGFNAYQAATPDAYAFLIDLGSLVNNQFTSTLYTTDGAHPNPRGHALAGALVTKSIVNAVGGGAVTTGSASRGIHAGGKL